MNKYPEEQQEIDLSSIEDEDEGKVGSDSLQIQQMGQPFHFQQYPDDSEEELFRNNVRQILMTDQMATDQQQQSDQFIGEPMKGSFLKDMELLGKTISFQSTWYNIYQDNNSYILQYLQNQEKDHSSLLQFFKGFKNLDKNNLQIESKYVIDFRKKNQKKGKSKSNVKKYRQDQKSSIRNSDFQFSVKSVNSSCLQKNQCSRQKTGRNYKSATKKMVKEQDKRKSQSSLNVKSGKKGQLLNLNKNNSCHLKKVGFRNVSQILKANNSQVCSLKLKEENKKKIVQRFNRKKRL